MSDARSWIVKSGSHYGLPVLIIPQGKICLTLSYINRKYRRIPETLPGLRSHRMRLASDRTAGLLTAGPLSEAGWTGLLAPVERLQIRFITGVFQNDGAAAVVSLSLPQAVGIIPSLTISPAILLFSEGKPQACRTSCWMPIENRCMRIPMLEQVRCLNLANSVAIVVYEGLRKQMFNNMR